MAGLPISVEIVAVPFSTQRQIDPICEEHQAPYAALLAS
jgi:hypothetical protein